MRARGPKERASRVSWIIGFARSKGKIVFRIPPVKAGVISTKTRKWTDAEKTDAKRSALRCAACCRRGFEYLAMNLTKTRLASRKIGGCPLDRIWVAFAAF